MENFTKDQLKLTAEKRDIKNYQNMSRNKLIRALDKSKRNFKDITLKKLDEIVKMQNLSQDELEQIARMINLPKNKLEQIAKKRGIKKYMNMSKEGLIIYLLKSGQSIEELRKSNYNNAEIKGIKEKFNGLRNKFSKKEIKEIRKNFHKKEKISHRLEELEKKKFNKTRRKKINITLKNLKRLKSLLKKQKKVLIDQNSIAIMIMMIQIIKE